MRAILFAAAGAVIVLAAVALSANVSTSQAAEGPWCASISIGESSEVIKCDFETLDACRREITGGNRGSCFPNPNTRASTPAPTPAPAAAPRPSR